MASPHPMPTALKVLTGNRGKRALPKYEPILPYELPKPPAFLSKDARAEWNRLVPAMYKAGLITTGDIAMLQQYCQSYGHWVQAEREFKASGGNYTLMNDKGNLYMNPLLTALNQASERLFKCTQEFGLSPSCRTKIMAFPIEPAEPEEYEKNPAGKFFNK
jgi:P27 family predicted phage terminase small subunit